MASSAGRRTAMESACSRSRGVASCHTLPRPKRKNASIPSRRWTKLRDAPADCDVDAGRTMLKRGFYLGANQRRSGREHAELAGHGDDGLDGAVEMLARVRGGDLTAQPR